MLVTVLTKKMAEELAKYYDDLGIKVKYMHSDIDTIERTEIIRGLRRGDFDMLIGINLLREGLDLPEVAIVAIFDAEKEGLLRSETSLIQNIARAARNLEGKVLLFADRITDSMRKAMDITELRRKKQDDFNKANGITPKSVDRKMDDSLKEDEPLSRLEQKKRGKVPKAEKEEIIKQLTLRMRDAAKNLEFEDAARLRDEITKVRAL